MASKLNAVGLEAQSFQHFIDSQPVSALQSVLFAFCFLIAAIDGFDVALMGFLAPAVAKALHLAPPLLAPVFGAGQFGAVAGALLIGPLADRYGRRRLMVISTIAFGAMTVATCFSDNVGELTILRFLTGIGLGGALPCATALTAEFCPERRRATLTTAMFCGFTFGSAVGGFATASIEPLLGWRGVIAWAGAVPLLLSPFIAWIVPESAEFLSRDPRRAHQMERLLRRIAGKRYLPGASIRTNPLDRLPTAKALFNSRPLGGILLLWVTSFMTLLVVYLLSSWMPTMLTAKGFSLQHAALATAMFQTGGTVGAVALGSLMDRVEPRKVLALAFCFAGAVIAMMGAFSASLPLLGVLIFLAGAFVSGGQVGVMAYTAAWFPPRVRATGVSWTSASGRTGSIIGSLAGGALLASGLGFSRILVLLAMPALLAAASIAWHGRSNGQ